MCIAGKRLLALEELLCEGFETTIDGIPVRLELLRAKNKFNPTAVDPTHFRNILNNVRFVYGERSTFAELQMHHQAILKYNDESHAHDHYNHFRSSLKDKYEEQLDPMLERQIIFFEEVRGVPVLLSLLVVVFATCQKDVPLIEQLPTSRRELYAIVVRGALRRRFGGD